MYPNRRNNKPLLITGVVMAAAIAGLVTLNFIVRKPKAPVETEAAKHSVLIYKSADGSIEYDKKLFSKEDDEKLMLSVTPQEMVALVVHPVEGKYFDDVSINATNDISTSYSYLVNDADGSNKRINFVMPDEDVLVNLKFSDEEKRPEEQKAPEASTEPETMMETPETNPYNLTIHGLTASILQSYSGQFDDQVFLQQLGDQLHISSAMSEYQGVTDVTFSEEEYKGEKDEGQVYHYIYFNNDPRWEALAVYYSKEKKYLFTEVERESETSQSETASSSSDNSQAGTGTSSGGSSGNYGGGGYSGGSSGTSHEVTTSFDILQVSTNLIKFAGGEDRFYSAAFDYVLKSGKTGELVGTLSSYEIQPKQNRALFTIELNTGETIEGTYDKAADSFKFSGLSLVR
ncbi:MAG: hypothetical protein MR488_01610 [Lachnospiraceae bacterium]|nr:hypothetical protein [Lachnospiraceae bacterium]